MNRHFVTGAQRVLVRFRAPLQPSNRRSLAPRCGPMTCSKPPSAARSGARCTAHVRWRRAARRSTPASTPSSTAPASRRPPSRDAQARHHVESPRPVTWKPGHCRCGRALSTCRTHTRLYARGYGRVAAAREGESAVIRPGTDARHDRARTVADEVAAFAEIGMTAHERWARRCWDARPRQLGRPGLDDGASG